MATAAVEEGGGASVLCTLQEIGIEIETVPYKEKGDRGDMRGMFCKNLLLKDRKGQFYLVVCPEDKDIHLKCLKQELKAHRNFSFASADDLHGLLGCGEGSVSPFGVIHDVTKKVLVVLDQALGETTEILNFHPLDPRFTTLISYENLIRFLEHSNHFPLSLEIKTKNGFQHS